MAKSRKSKGGFAGIGSLAIYAVVAAVGYGLIRKMGTVTGSIVGGGAGGSAGGGLIPQFTQSPGPITSTSVAFGPSTLPPIGWKTAHVASVPVGASYTGAINKRTIPFGAIDGIKDPLTGELVHYFAQVMVPGKGYSEVRVVPG